MLVACIPGCTMASFLSYVFIHIGFSLHTNRNNIFHDVIPNAVSVIGYLTQETGKTIRNIDNLVHKVINGNFIVIALEVVSMVLDGFHFYYFFMGLFAKQSQQQWDCCFILQPEQNKIMSIIGCTKILKHLYDVHSSEPTLPAG